MSTQFGSWYLRGDGNQPAGPFTAEALIQSWRAGRLEASTICWREGMTQWLPLAQVEPFASAIASASVPRQATPAAARPPAQRVAAPPPLRSAPRSGKRRPTSAAWIGWAVAGGIAVVCALVAGVVLLLEPHNDAQDSGSTALHWGNPVSVNAGGTTFLVGLKDAWWTDYGGAGPRQTSRGDNEERKTFLVVYYYKNLGPRERSFSLGQGGLGDGTIAEIKTDKGHIFSGGPAYVCGTRDVGGWQPRGTTKVDETGESALVFNVPHDEIPTELITSGGLNLDFRLPHARFGFRRYSDVFGFLPQRPEVAVPGLVKALQEKDSSICDAALEALGKMGPAAKDAVPEITRVLLNNEYMGKREAAAKALGEIGSAAKEAIPALRDPLRISRPRVGGAYLDDLLTAAREALAKIGDTAATPISPNGTTQIPEGLATAPPSPATPQTPPRAEPGTSLFGPMKPTAPRQRNTPSYHAPQGLREGVDRLLQRLEENHELTGNFGAYRVTIPPEYTGDETEYEIGLLRPGSRFYAFHTVDGGQTWFRRPPTNPYLKAVEEATAKGTGGKRPPRHPTPGQGVKKVAQGPGPSGDEAPPRATPPADEEPHPKGSLSGTWKAAAGALFRIDDDGTMASVELVSSGFLRSFSGKLTRGKKPPDPKFLTGTLYAVFNPDAPKQYPIHVTCTVDSSNRLLLRCGEWPVWNAQGRSIGTKLLKETWTRQESRHGTAPD